METKLEQIAVKAVNQLPKSVVREIRTPRSVGAGGGRPPPATRWAVSNDRPLYVADCLANQQILPSSEENGEPLSSLWRMSLCGRLGPVFQAPLFRLDGILGRA
jgi:hypothetical protein